MRIAAFSPVRHDPATLDWPDVAANNHGFYSEHDYPWSPPSDGGPSPTIVIVLGGSVAHWMTLLAGRRIGHRVGEALGLAGSGVHLLNVASGGFKQPQPLLALTLLLSLGQQIDAVVLIDGFNELALSFVNWRTGADAAGPSAAHLRAAGDAPNPSLVDPYSVNECLTQATQVWARSATLLRDTCGVRGIPLIHIIQPNQYFGGRKFSIEEKSLAISASSPYRTAVELGYPLILDALVSLARQGCPVIDAARLLDKVAEPVYADNCCHLNYRGTEILADLAADNMIAALSARLAKRASSDAASSAAGRMGLVRMLRGRKTPDRQPAESPPDLYPMW